MSDRDAMDADNERELPDWVLQSIFRTCEIQDIARSACVSRRWRILAYEESLWKELCASRFGLSTPCDHHELPCSSFKEAYRNWHSGFQKYPLSLVIRAKNCWEFLRTWTSTNFPEVTASFAPGASEEDLDHVEASLGCSLPLSVRALYRFCGGQEIPRDLYMQDKFESAPQRNYVGLLGGYSFYNHTANVHLLSLRDILHFTHYFVDRWGLSETSRWIIIAASVPLHKFFLLDCSNGSVHVGTARLVIDGDMINCVPSALGTTDMQDAMLLWLEEYCTQLRNGMFSVQKTAGVCRISLFPEQEPLCTEAVTCGVQVRCSAVFVPELSTLQGGDNSHYMFSYLVRMRLLPSSVDSSFHSCQLLRRHWIIRENGMVVDQVHGDAVIGLYPLLNSGGETFMYASCSPLGNPQGSIEGDFTFVPGSKDCPEGPEFYVKVAQFDLNVPKFIF